MTNQIGCPSKLCCKCHKNPRHFSSAYCKDCLSDYYKEYYLTNKELLKANQKERSEIRKQKVRERKLALVESKGGKCERCGYKKNMAALGFHHPNGRESPVKRNRSNLSPYESPQNRKFKIEEVILLCLNCHAELEHPELIMERPIT